MSLPPHRPPSGDAAYDRLANAGRSDIAWEWLRRDPVYRQLTPGSVQHTDHGLRVERAPAWCEKRWGCLDIADADRSGGQPILWSAIAMPAVLSVEAVPAGQGGGPAFDLRYWQRHTMLIADAGGPEHLLLHGDGRTFRIDVVGGSLRGGPVDLRYRFDGTADHERAIETLRRLLLLRRTGDFMALPSDTPAPRRSIDALRVHDALSGGASIRDIGTMLYGHERVRSEWLASGEALKSQCRRLIAYARHMAGGGFKTFLR